LPHFTSDSTRSGGIFDLDRKRSRIALIERDAGQPDFWNDNARAQGLLKEKSGLEASVQGFERVKCAVDRFEHGRRKHQPLNSCHPERSASRHHQAPTVLGAESKDPADLSSAIRCQGILTSTFPVSPVLPGTNLTKTDAA